MSDVHDLTALETAATIRRGELTSTEATEHALRRAEGVGAHLGAFAVLTPERALAAARAVDRAIGAGEATGPLAGVPLAVKDLTATAGVVTARGSLVGAGHVPDVDDDVVGLLRAAGTVSIGKTAVPEFGLPCYTEPAGAPPAVTPWDPSRSAGGSSGGAAAAVAGGVLPCAHGTDGGGSVRIPASVCGLVGLKTTRGRVPAGPAGGDPAGLSVHGPLARTVADAAALLDALAAPAPGEPFVPTPPPDGGFLAAARRPGPRLRIGLDLTPPVRGVGVDVVLDPACRAAAERTAALLTDLGHVVEPTHAALGEGGVEAFLRLWTVLSLGDPVAAADEERLQPLTRYLRARGREVDGITAMGALATVQATTRRLVAERAGLDAVLTPTVALPPRPVGWFVTGRGAERSRTIDAGRGAERSRTIVTGRGAERSRTIVTGRGAERSRTIGAAAEPADDFARQVAFTPWTAIANLTGEPALTLPLERSDGLPIGVSLRGRRGEEALLLTLGAELEAARPWSAHRPPSW